MTLRTTASLLAEARSARRGIAALNANTLEQVEAILAAAEQAGTPVIVQLSENAIGFHQGLAAPLFRAAAAAIDSASADAALHLDHSTSLDLCKAAVDNGASSVMFDAAHLDFADNVAATSSAASWAAEVGILLEAELGAIGGKEGAHAPGVRTDPDEARQFVDATGVHALAIAVGSEHAQHSRRARLDMGLIEAISDAVSVPLVLHGSSGVPDDEIVEAIRRGITKVNVGTALNIAFTGALREHLVGHPQQSDPRPGLIQARLAMAGVARHLLQTVASDGALVAASPAKE